MASSFAFGFSGNDIEADAGDVDEDGMQIDVPDHDAEHTERQEKLIPPQQHTLKDILSTLPSSISYNTLSVPIPFPLSVNSPHPNPSSRHHHSLPIPRRSLFDILTQLKAESDIDIPIPASITHLDPHNPTHPTNPTRNQNDDLLTNLETGTDLRSGIYEGGFKTWECGVDLAGYLASKLELEHDRVEGGGLASLLSGRGGSEADARSGDGRVVDCGDDEDDDDGGFDVVELGAGSGIPSLVLLNYVLNQRRPRGQGGRDVDGRLLEGGAEGIGGRRRRAGKVRFVLCDYNIEVLKLVTGANILLQILKGPFSDRDQGREGSDVRFPPDQQQEQQQQPEQEEEQNPRTGEGEIEPITPELQDEILSSLYHCDISIDFISGDWGGDDFVNLVLPPLPHQTTNPLSPHKKHNTPGPRPRPLLLLASETLYSPSSLPAFTSTLISLLRRGAEAEAGVGAGVGAGAGAGAEAKAGPTRSTVACVAAKKIYFGVGGGVDDFVAEVRRRDGARVEVVWDVGGDKAGGGVGVGRVVLRVGVD